MERVVFVCYLSMLVACDMYDPGLSARFHADATVGESAISCLGANWRPNVQCNHMLSDAIDMSEDMVALDRVDARDIVADQRDSVVDTISDMADAILSDARDSRADTGSFDTGHDTGADVLTDVIASDVDVGVDAEPVWDGGGPIMRIWLERRADMGTIQAFMIKVMTQEGSTVLLDWSATRCIGGLHMVADAAGFTNIVECIFNPADLPWGDAGFTTRVRVFVYPVFRLSGMTVIPVCPDSGDPPCPTQYSQRWMFWSGDAAVTYRDMSRLIFLSLTTGRPMFEDGITYMPVQNIPMWLSP